MKPLVQVEMQAPAWAPRELRERLRCQHIADLAYRASGARIVQLTLYEPRTELVHSLAWAGFHVGWARMAILATQRLFPSFDPLSVTPSVHVNPWNERVYLQGLVVQARFDQVAAGAVEPAVLRTASSIARLKESVMVPLRVHDAVFGALGFHGDPFSQAQINACQGCAGLTGLYLEATLG